MRGLVRVAAAILACCLGSMAHGQSVAAETGPVTQIVPRRSVDAYSRILGLSPEQREQAMLLHDGYRAQLQTARKEAEKAHEKLSGERGEDNPPPEPRAREKLLMAYTARANALERTFFGDLRATLEPAQAERFEKVERARRREVGFRFAFASGAGADVLSIAERAGVSRSGEVGEALDRYEEAVDRALAAKQAAILGAFEKAMTSEDIDSDQKLMQEVLGDIFSASFVVRDVNKRAVREVAAALPEDVRVKFESGVREASFPKVYRASEVMKAVAYARENGRVAGDKVEELERLASSYEREAAGVNSRLASVIEAREQEMPTRFMEMMSEAWEGPREGTEIGDAFNARKALDELYLGKVRALLTEAQLEEAPDTEPLSFSDVAMLDLDMDEGLIKEDDEE